MKGEGLGQLVGRLAVSVNRSFRSILFYIMILYLAFLLRNRKRKQTSHAHAHSGVIRKWS